MTLAHSGQPRRYPSLDIWLPQTLLHQTHLGFSSKFSSHGPRAGTQLSQARSHGGFIPKGTLTSISSVAFGTTLLSASWSTVLSSELAFTVFAAPPSFSQPFPTNPLLQLHTPADAAMLQQPCSSLLAFWLRQVSVMAANTCEDLLRKARLLWLLALG